MTEVEPPDGPKKEKVESPLHNAHRWNPLQGYDNYHVDFTKIDKDGNKQMESGAACFSRSIFHCGSGDWRGPWRKIIYRCEVDKALDAPEIQFWLDFLTLWLTVLPWSYEGHKDTIDFTIELPPHYPSFLLYTTAFRYFDEYPAVIAEVYYRCLGIANEKTFDCLQEVHREFQVYELTKTLPGTKGNWGGHSLIYAQIRYGSRTPLKNACSLKEFNDKFKDGKFGSVNSLFDK